MVSLFYNFKKFDIIALSFNFPIENFYYVYLIGGALYKLFWNLSKMGCSNITNLLVRNKLEFDSVKNTHCILQDKLKTRRN